MEKKAGNKAEFTLRCDVDHNPAWKCEAELQMEMLKNNGLWIPSSNSTMVNSFTFKHMLIVIFELFRFMAHSSSHR